MLGGGGVSGGGLDYVNMGKACLDMCSPLLTRYM